MNKYSIFTKTKNVIESCETLEHLKVANRYAEAAKRAITKIINDEGIDDIFEKVLTKDAFINQINCWLVDKRYKINLSIFPKSV